MFPENHEEDVALYMSTNGGITFNKVPPIKEIKPVQEIEMPYNLLASGLIRKAGEHGDITFQPLKSVEDVETINVSETFNVGGSFQGKIKKDIFPTNNTKEVVIVPFNFDMLSICRKKPTKSNNMLIINKEKKYVLFKYLGEEYKVECHEKDKFNWFIGFGLALSQRYGDLKKWKNAREYFRNSKTRKLDYKNYAQWCVYQFYENDLTKVKELQNKVKEINEYGKVDL